MKITNIKIVKLDNPVPVYDVVNATPYNNFLIKLGDKSIVSHNCGILDEVNFQNGASIDFTKSKIMKTYNAIKIRMRSRFTKNGVLASKLFIVSSKKSEMDFIESYVETIKDSPNVIISDEPQWNVKPPGTFSNKRFKVAVGNKKVKSKIISREDDLDALKKQGYEIMDIPLELYADFNRDIDRALMDLAGVSCNIVSKFITYENLHRAHCNRRNPFSNTVISIGTLDNLEIMDFFDPSIVPEEIYTKPIFIHLDMSLTGDRTGIGATAVMGLREDMAYVDGEVVPVQEMIYAHVFSLGILCPAGAQISLEKNRKFIYYLKYNLGWNIKGVSADGYQSADTLQQLNQAGFDARLVSLDKSPNGYMYLKASINERRISMLDLEELNNEVINLEQNNQTGKVDHPLNGSKDIADGLAGSLFNASQMVDRTSLYVNSDYQSISDTNEYVPTNDLGDMVVSSMNEGFKKEAESKPVTKKDIDNELAFIQSESDKAAATADRARLAKIKSQISQSDRAMIKDDEIEDSYFNSRDSDMLIW